MNDQYIVISGSPFDGFTHYGTFDFFDKAQRWADENLGFDVEWWVARLESVSEKETA